MLSCNGKKALPPKKCQRGGKNSPNFFYLLRIFRIPTKLVEKKISTLKKNFNKKLTVFWKCIFWLSRRHLIDQKNGWRLDWNDIWTPCTHTWYSSFKNDITATLSVSPPKNSIFKNHLFLKKKIEKWWRLYYEFFLLHNMFTHLLMAYNNNLWGLKRKYLIFFSSFKI